MNGGIEILNIGPLELIFILAMMILFLGPKQMAQLARQIGSMIRSVRHSSLWKDIIKVDREIRDLPVQLAREAGFEEQMEEIRRSTQIPPMEIGAKETESPAPEKSPGDVRSSGGRLRPPMRRGTPPPPPRTELPVEVSAEAEAEPSTASETKSEQTLE